MKPVMKWTVYARGNGSMKFRALCQFAETDRDRAALRAQSLMIECGLETKVALAPESKPRVVKISSRRLSCVGYRKFGVPQHS